MELTVYEQDMLNGKYGEGYQLAMEVLVQMGELYGARRFLPVKNAHIDAAAYTTIWDAGTEFLEFLVRHNVRVPQPTTINPISRDIKNWKALGASEEFAMKSKRMEDAYIKMGVIPTWTCAPYQCGNLPQFGEVVSWSESNAVNFVNSVIGARAERLPDLMDVCCAVCGRVPEYGHYLTENRRGDILFRLKGFVDVGTGVIQDVHHDLCTQNMSGKVLCIPYDRGSCSGSGMIFEMIRQGSNPAALLCVEAEAVLALGPVIGKKIYGRSMPVRTVSAEVLSQIKTGDTVTFEEDSIRIN